MKRYTLVVYLALFAVLGCLYAAHAEAGIYGVGRPFAAAEERAYSMADAYWQRQPNLCTSVHREVVAPGALGENVLGRATMPEATPIECNLFVVEGLTETELCSVMRHEYGHLLGFGHDDPELATMPPCEAGFEVEQRRWAWQLWHEWQVICLRMKARTPHREHCLHRLRRRANRLRTHFAS